jgi:hypothetical protein
LIDYLLLYVPLKNFSLYGDVTITGEGLQNLGFARRSGRDLYRAIPDVTRSLGFSGLIPMDHPHLVASYDTQRDVEDLF